MLQELGGWNSPEMVNRYAHFSVDHLAEYAGRIVRARPNELNGIPRSVMYKGGRRRNDDSVKESFPIYRTNFGTARNLAVAA